MPPPDRNFLADPFTILSATLMKSDVFIVFLVTVRQIGIKDA